MGDLRAKLPDLNLAEVSSADWISSLFGPNELRGEVAEARLRSAHSAARRV
jgi:hypothetical protein